MKTLLEDLQKELYTLGASVYQQANAASQAADGSSGQDSNNSSQSNDDVIDAEFTETK